MMKNILSFYNFNLNMAATAAHLFMLYTAHTFSLETGELLTIDDIFNKFVNFAEKYIQTTGGLLIKEMMDTCFWQKQRRYSKKLKIMSGI